MISGGDWGWGGGHRAEGEFYFAAWWFLHVFDSWFDFALRRGIPGPRKQKKRLQTI